MARPSWPGEGGGGIISAATLARGTLGLGVAKFPPTLGRARTGVAPPIDTRDAFGVVVVLSLRFFTDEFSVPARTLSSCLAVIPTYLLARDPAVIFGVDTVVLVLVLVPSSVLAGRPSSSLALGLRAPYAARRPGVVDGGRPKVVDDDRTPEGVALPLMIPCEACEDAMDRWEATEAGRDGPDVGGDSLVARTNTPQLGAQLKYGTLGSAGCKELDSPIDTAIVLAFASEPSFELNTCPCSCLELRLAEVAESTFHAHRLNPDAVSNLGAELCVVSVQYTRT